MKPAKSVARVEPFAASKRIWNERAPVAFWASASSSDADELASTHRCVPVDAGADRHDDDVERVVRD